MSRIYEALQRADSERKHTQETAGWQANAPADFSSAEELPSAIGEISFESIPQHPWNPSLDSFPALAERGMIVEQFRALRTHVYQLGYQDPLKTILVSSALPGEGKTFVTANLACSLARNGFNQILLIDGDMRRPMLHNLLGAPNNVGLSEYLAGDAEIAEILQRDSSPEIVEKSGARSVSNLTFIPAGKCGVTSSEVISSRAFEDLIVTLSPHFDWILIDSPPVQVVTDAVDLARPADAVLLVARSGSTPYEAAQRTKLAFGDKRILGFVLNATKEVPRSSSYSYYYIGEEAGGKSSQKASAGRRK